MDFNAGGQHASGKRTSWWHRVPLWGRLLVVIAVGILLSTVLLLRAYTRERDRVEQSAQRELLGLAQLVAREDEQLLERVRTLLRVLGTVKEVRSAAPAQCSAFLWDTLEREPEVFSLGVARTDGTVVCSSHEQGVGGSIADRGFFHQALETRAFSVGTYTKDRATGRVALHFAQPVLDDAGREVVGVVFLALDLSWLDGFARRVRLPEGSFIAAWDRSGTVLAAYPDAERWVGRSLGATPIYTQSRREQRGVMEASPFGEPLLWAFTQVRPEGETGELHLGVAVPAEALTAALGEDLRAHLAALWVAGLLAAAALLLATWRWVLRPLRKVEAAAASIGEGRLEARTAAEGAPGELGRVAVAFDQMAQKVESETRSRDAFVNQVAHELKTPLTTLKLKLQRLRLGLDRGQEVTQAEVRAAVDEADRQAWRLARLVESLLESRALIHQDRPLRRERLDLGEVIEDVVSHHRPSFAAADTELRVDVEEPVVGYWDRELIVQLLHQLLSNALKYAQGRPVTVIADALNGEARLVVRDRGPGISARDQVRIFEPYARTVASYGTGGLGLGLWLARQTATRMGGQVSLRSRPGEGATFIITLPRHLEDAHGAADHPTVH